MNKKRLKSQLIPTFPRRSNHSAIAMSQSHLAWGWATVATRTPVWPGWQHTVIWAREQAWLLCDRLHL